MIDSKDDGAIYCIKFEDGERDEQDEDGITQSVVQYVDVDIPVAQIHKKPMNVLQYMKKRARRGMPTWFDVAKDLALMQPSSCAAERVFSQLESHFPKSGTRGSAKADIINATIKLRCHDRAV